MRYFFERIASVAFEKYKWSKFGLMPLLGAVVGPILILLGIFKNRDKFTVIYGMICILLTFSFYPYLLKEITNEEQKLNNIEGITQFEINNLVKEIEFYKITNHEYPEKLEDLNTSSSIADIQDPILSLDSKRENINFRYEKVGDKYRLYSVGIDKIGNTDDDIYPDFKTSTNTNFGFIYK